MELELFSYQMCEIKRGFCGFCWYLHVWCQIFYQLGLNSHLFWLNVTFLSLFLLPLFTFV